MSVGEAVGRYAAAAAAGDMEALASTLSDGVVWQQPGANQLSGDHVGPDAVVAHLGRFMQLSGGTFTLETESVVESGSLVVATVRFTASRPGHPDLDQRGVDVFRVVDGKIVEVWLIGEDQGTEDAFWARA